MARPKNTLKTVQVTISTTEQVKDVLEALTSSGMYGKNAADTAQRLMLERIRDLQRDGMAPKTLFNATIVDSNKSTDDQQQPTD